jgi:glycosyltransferase involved in cell wall biosynthesis
LRVAVDARLVAYQPAGIGNYTLSLLAGLADLVDREHLVALISRKDTLVAQTLPVVDRRRLMTPPHHRLEQAALAAELVGLDVDVYHAPDFVPPLARRFPAVVTVHDLAFVRWPELLTAESRRYYGQIGRALESAERTIAVSRCTRDDLVELLGADPRRIDVVHEAADPRYRPATPDEIASARARHGLPDEYFLFVGTREPRKNLGRLLEAYASVATQPGCPGLVVVGRAGWLGEDLEARARSLGIAERVVFTGGLPSDELVAIYSGALAFVFPSLYEGFGLPALEAMACGAPVVAARAGSLPEVVGDAALLVDPLDSAHIAAGMARVWREPSLRAELIERGRAQVGRFSWRRAAEETLDVYRRAA